MTDTTTLPPLPDLSGSSPLWLAIVAWGEADVREGSRAALKVDAVVADMLRAYARAALAQSAQPALDPEPLIRACIPGGSICDPQQVADAIRRYLDAWPQEQSAQAPAPNLVESHQIEEAQSEPAPAQPAPSVEAVMAQLEAIAAEIEREGHLGWPNGIRSAVEALARGAR